MKLLLKKEEEEGEGEEEGVVGGRDPEAHAKERMVKVEDPHPMEDTEEDLVVQTVHREPHGLGPT